MIMAVASDVTIQSLSEETQNLVHISFPASFVGKREVIAAFDLDISRIADALRQHDAKLARNGRIASALEYEGRHLDQWQQPRHVDFADSALDPRGIFGGR